MMLRLDTHTFLCWSLEPERLPKKVIETLKDPGNVEGLAIVGKDPLFSAYPDVRIIWSEI